MKAFFFRKFLNHIYFYFSVVEERLIDGGTLTSSGESGVKNQIRSVTTVTTVVTSVQSKYNFLKRKLTVGQ